jgi:hypothetical protein
LTDRSAAGGRRERPWNTSYQLYKTVS